MVKQSAEEPADSTAKSKSNWKKIKKLEYDKYGFTQGLQTPIKPAKPSIAITAEGTKKIVRDK